MTDDSRRRQGSLTSVAGDYNSDNDLEEALLSGAHYGQRPRGTRGRLARSHSVSDNTTLQDFEHSASSKPEANPGHGEDGGPSGERPKRPLSGRRFRLTASFDDGCSGRERVTARISSTSLRITSIAITSSSCSVNSDDGSSSRKQPQKPARRRSSSVSRTGVNRGISNSTSSSPRDQPRVSNVPKMKMSDHKDGGMNPNRPASNRTAECSTTPSDKAKIILNVSNRKDVMTISKRPAPLAMRRASSLDMNVMKSYNNGTATMGRQSTAARSGHQRNCKAGVHRAATTSANHSSPRLMRCDRLQLTGNHTARYQ